MHTCGRWYATVVAGPPHLLPVAVLACPPLELSRLNSDRHGLVDAWCSCKSDAASMSQLVSQAARLPSNTWRVRVEGEVQVRA